MMLFTPPHIILPPEKPAIVRASDLKGLPSWQQMARRERAVREATFPFPFIPPSSTAAYATGAVNFDGTNDYQTIAALTGIANGAKGILSFWIKFTGSDATLLKIFDALNETLKVERNASNKLAIVLFNNAVTVTRISFTSTASITADSTWHHVAAAWDITSTRTGTVHFYIDGASAGSDGGTGTGTDIKYNIANYTVGARSDTPTFSNRLNADLAEFYFNTTEYLDFSSAANLQKFRTSGGKPVDLGAAGATPTGTTPIVYLKHTTGSATTDFQTNLGSGGNFTLTGTLTQSSNSPSD